MRSDSRWPAPLVAHAFAVVREAATRVLGQRHHDVQLIGGYALLRGMVAEMGTARARRSPPAWRRDGCAGRDPVHVVTVNGYLAARDAAALVPLYEFLGLTVGVVTESVAQAERAAAYRRDITYCTNKDLAFDYMRDRLQLGRRMGNLRRKAAQLIAGSAAGDGSRLRGLHFAIIDEADSVLIDEARTPLILSGGGDVARNEAVFDQALGAGARTASGQRLHRVRARAADGAAAALSVRLQQAERLGPPWDEIAERERLIGQALTALHLLHRDEHYLVRDGKAEIIDEFYRPYPARSNVERRLARDDRAQGRLVVVGPPRDPRAHDLSTLLPALPTPGRHDRDREGSRRGIVARLSAETGVDSAQSSEPSHGSTDRRPYRRGGEMASDRGHRRCPSIAAAPRF
ncbi:MAG: hypothetical protein WDO24_04835 [Pseudomonadota bacterium]